VVQWGAGDVTRVQAIVRERYLNAVTERLILIGVRGLTITLVNGLGGSIGDRAVFRGGLYFAAFAPRILLEWVGLDEQADAVVRAIQQSNGIGKIRDGSIFLQRVDDVVRIRTGERGRSAV